MEKVRQENGLKKKNKLGKYPKYKEKLQENGLKRENTSKEMG